MPAGPCGLQRPTQISLDFAGSGVVVTVAHGDPVKDLLDDFALRILLVARQAVVLCGMLVGPKRIGLRMGTIVRGKKSLLCFKSNRRVSELAIFDREQKSVPSILTDVAAGVMTVSR